MYEGSHVEPANHDGLSQRIERLYRRLIALAVAPAIEPALAEVLRLLAEVARCTLVFVEISGDDGKPLYWLGHTPNALPPGAIRSRVSRELIQRTLHERRTIEAEKAKARASWDEQQFSLCTPIGGVLPIGVVYADSARPFTEDDRERIESVAFRLAEVQGALTRARPPTLPDRIRNLQEHCVREEMERHRGNITAVARTLGVGRSFIYHVLEGRDVSG